MITSLKQAMAVQQRRVDSGKFGIAKAVRRYFLRDHNKNYRKKIDSLQVAWPVKKEDPA